MRFILFSPLIFELQRLTNFTKPRNGRAFDSRARETYNTGAKLMNGTYKTYVVGLIGRPLNPISPRSPIQEDLMTFLDRINEDLKAAMKSKDSDRLSTLRMVKTALKNREIDKMEALTDEEAIKVMQSLVKQRRDSIEQYQQAGRIELAEKEASEIKVIEEYLPAALDDAAIARVVEETIVETGASSMKEMGAVMKAVMAKLAGQTVDGKAVNQIVKSKLGG
jgi:uncharacterized protein YqeY